MRAEMKALHRATELLLDMSGNDKPQKVRLYTDCRSMLKALDHFREALYEIWWPKSYITLPVWNGKM